MRYWLPAMAALLMCGGPAAGQISPPQWLDRCLVETTASAVKEQGKPSCLAMVLWICDHAPSSWDCRLEVYDHAIRRTRAISAVLPDVHPAEQLDKVYQTRLGQLQDTRKLAACNEAKTVSLGRICQLKHALSQYSLAIFLEDFTTRRLAP